MLAYQKNGSIHAIERQPQVRRPRKEMRKSKAERDVLKIVKNGFHTNAIAKVTIQEVVLCLEFQGPTGSQLKKISIGDGPTGSQSKKRSKREATSFATQTDKGKAPTIDDEVKKKRVSKKKVIVLGGCLVFMSVMYNVCLICMKVMHNVY
ncbi:hypothetical protein Tco_1310229 [Tanacetum coccineum]